MERKGKERKPPGLTRKVIHTFRKFHKLTQVILVFLLHAALVAAEHNLI